MVLTTTGLLCRVDRMRSHETTSLLFYTEPNNLCCFCDKTIFLALEKEIRPKAFFMNCKFGFCIKANRRLGFGGEGHQPQVRSVWGRRPCKFILVSRWHWPKRCWQLRPCWHVSFSKCGFALIGLPFLCVEAHAQAEGIDGEREDNCRTLLCRDRIERLKNQMSINNLLRRGNTMEQSQMQLKTGSQNCEHERTDQEHNWGHGVRWWYG